MTVFLSLKYSNRFVKYTMKDIYTRVGTCNSHIFSYDIITCMAIDFWVRFAVNGNFQSANLRRLQCSTSISRNSARRCELQDVMLFIRSNKLNFESESDIQAPPIRIPRIDQTWVFFPHASRLN